MKVKSVIDTAALPDRIKQTLDADMIPVYGWMLDANLHNAELLVYAAIFETLRHEPRKPKNINLADLGKRLHYERATTHLATDTLVKNGMLFRQGSGRSILYSLYPFNTLDLK